MGLALALLLLLPVPPPARDHFPDDPGAAHVFLVVDTETGETVRSDDPVAAEREPFPAGDTVRFVVALAGLEDGVLDPDESVACDDRCWAGGRHGELPLAEALAYSCDTWFREAVSRVGADALARTADHAAFASRPRRSPSGDELAFEWEATAREWVEFWRRLGRGELARRSGATSTLLAAGSLAVSSPRGAARALYEASRRAGAFSGASPAGAWVTGTFRADGHSWVFALFVQGGTRTLGVVRAAALLEETRRVYRNSTRERGGRPLPPRGER